MADQEKSKERTGTQINQDIQLAAQQIMHAVQQTAVLVGRGDAGIVDIGNALETLVQQNALAAEYDTFVAIIRHANGEYEQ